MRFSASGGWIRRLRSQDRMAHFSIQSSFNTFYFLLRPCSDSVPAASLIARIHWFPVRHPPNSCRSCNVRWFQTPARRGTKIVKGVCFVILRPFAPPPFGGFLTTTASADFSQTLIRETSPGKVLKLSARAAQLYPMRLSVTVGFRVP